MRKIITLLIIGYFAIGCANYSPAFPGSTHNLKITDQPNMYITKDPTSLVSELKKKCPNGSTKLNDQYISENGFWYVLQRYECLNLQEN